MRLVFAGTPAAAVPTLRALAASEHEIVAVVTRADAPVGRKRVLTPSPVAAVADDCDWPVQTWQSPISPAELMIAQSVFGSARSDLMTGAAFTDTALLKDDKLDNYRILHFATHGLVTAPRNDCPPRPALVTSFGGPGSDGLLSFREIFDLKLDADVVIFDPATPFEFSTATSHMNVDYDLFEGERSTGSVRQTLCRGTVVYDRGEILTQPGHGRFIPRSLTAAAPVRA